MAFNPGRFKLSLRVADFTLWHYVTAKLETYADVTGDDTFFVDEHDTIAEGEFVCVEVVGGARMYRVLESGKAGVVLRRV